MRLTLPNPKPWQRKVLFVLAILPALFAVGVFVFIARGQLAFDEARCPYVEGETRDVTASARMREDARRCMDEVEEHRWVLLRAGEPPLELGRRRLTTEFYGDGYRWEAHEENGRVEVHIHNPGIEEVRLFREPAPDAGVGD